MSKLVWRLEYIEVRLLFDTKASCRMFAYSAILFQAVFTSVCFNFVEIQCTMYAHKRTNEFD